MALVAFLDFGARGGAVEELALETERYGEAHVSARGETRDGEAVGIKLEGVCVAGEPEECISAVFYGCREGEFGRKSVCNAHDDGVYLVDDDTAPSRIVVCGS